MKVISAGGSAGELLVSGLLLLYTAILAPVQICLWNYDDPCNAFPTLYFDVIVDAFFIVQTPLPASLLPSLTFPRLPTSYLQSVRTFSPVAYLIGA